jgi:hypothetical protein
MPLNNNSRSRIKSDWSIIIQKIAHRVKSTGTGRKRTWADKSQLADFLQTFNINAVEAKQIQKILQFSTDLETINDTKKNPANLNRFKNGQRIKYQGKQKHTWHQPHIGGTRSNTTSASQKLTTTTPSHLPHLLPPQLKTNNPPPRPQLDPRQ